MLQQKPEIMQILELLLEKNDFVKICTNKVSLLGDTKIGVACLTFCIIPVDCDGHHAKKGYCYIAIKEERK
jgi:hypothetical protein